MLGDQLRRLPMRDVDDLDGEVRFSYSFENKVVTTFGCVFLRRSFLRRSVLEQKHAAIAIGDQEKPPNAWLIDQDRVGFVASDEFTPIGSKVDKDVMLIQHSESFSLYAERVSNATMSTIASREIVRTNDG